MSTKELIGFVIWLASSAAFLPVLFAAMLDGQDYPPAFAVLALNVGCFFLGIRLMAGADEFRWILTGKRPATKDHP